MPLITSQNDQAARRPPLPPCPRGRLAVIPSLNIAAGLLGFFFLGGISRTLARLPRGWGGQPMTAQVGRWAAVGLCLL